jgi:hypothetical protein
MSTGHLFWAAVENDTPNSSTGRQVVELVTHG